MGINWSMRADTSLSFGIGELTSHSGNKVNLATLTPVTFAAMLQILSEDAGMTLLQEPQITTFNNSPATTYASLLANKILLPAETALCMDFKPTIPTTPATTISTSLEAIVSR